MTYVYIIILAVISGLFYRMGGIGGSARTKFPGWPLWLFNTKIRDLGCPLVCFIALAFVLRLEAVWWAHFLSFGLMFGSLTTYWDKIYKNTDNFWIHGFVAGLAYLPYAIVTDNWIGFGIRCILLAVFMGGWSAYFKNDVVEETGRGAILALSLPLMLV